MIYKINVLEAKYYIVYSSSIQMMFIDKFKLIHKIWFTDQLTFNNVIYKLLLMYLNMLDSK